MIGFGIAYLLCTGAVYFLHRRALAPLLAGFALLVAVTSVGPGPVAVILFIAASALAVGDLFQRACRLPRTPSLLPLTMLLGICPMILVVSLTVHFPINYPALYWVALAVPLLMNRAALSDYGREVLSWFRTRAVQSAPGYCAVAAAGFIVLAHLLVVLKPEVSHDGLATHLTVPAYVADFRQWHFDVMRMIWALIPMGADWSYTIAYMLGGEFAARLINFLFLLAILAMLYRLARRWLGRAQAWLPVCLFASTPLVQLVTGSLFVENFQAALILCGLVSIELPLRGAPAGWMVPATAFLGTALAVKFGSLAFVLPILVIGGIRLAVSKSAKWGVVLAAIAVLLLTALVPYLYAWRRTGNPFYPFLAQSFPSPGLPAIDFVNPFQPHLDAVNTLDRLTFSSHQLLESHDGALGFHYLVFLPVALLVIGRAGFRRVWLALLAALVASASILSSQPNLRYLYPSLPLLTVLVACALARLLRWNTVVSRAVVVLAGVLIGLNVCFLPASGWYHKEFHVWHPLNDDYRSEYLARHVPVRKLVEYLNLRHPGAPVWFLGPFQVAGFRGRAYTAQWYQPIFSRDVKACRDGPAVRDLAQRERLEFFIAPKDAGSYPAITAPVWEFLRESTEQEWEYGGFRLLRWKAAPAN